MYTIFVCFFSKRVCRACIPFAICKSVQVQRDNCEQRSHLLFSQAWQMGAKRAILDFKLGAKAQTQAPICSPCVRLPQQISYAVHIHLQQPITFRPRCCFAEHNGFFGCPQRLCPAWGNQLSCPQAADRIIVTACSTEICCSMNVTLASAARQLCRANCSTVSVHRKASTA